jgi:hypothetical protein
MLFFCWWPESWYSPTCCRVLKRQLLVPNISIWLHTLYLNIHNLNQSINQSIFTNTTNPVFQQLDDFFSCRVSAHVPVYQLLWWYLPSCPALVAVSRKTLEINNLTTLTKKADSLDLEKHNILIYSGLVAILIHFKLASYVINFTYPPHLEVQREIKVDSSFHFIHETTTISRQHAQNPNSCQTNTES